MNVIMFSQEANTKLLKLIEERPCLYNKDLPDYGDKRKQLKAWKEVARNMGWLAVQCKERWRNLRNGFLRHLKRLSRGDQVRPYYLRKPMEFTLPFLRPANSEQISKEVIDLLRKQDDEEKEERRYKRKSLDSESSNQMGAESPNSYVVGYLPSTSDQSKEDRESYEISHIEPNDYRVDNIPERSSNFDMKTEARKMFLYSLLPDVCAMTDAQMRQFKMKVLTVIEDILVDES